MLSFFSEPGLDISPLDQVFIVGQTLRHTANPYETFQLTWVNVTSLLDKHNDEAPLVVTGARMGLHNLSYGAFVIHDNHMISAARVSDTITVSGTPWCQCMEYVVYNKWIKAGVSHFNCPVTLDTSKRQWEQDMLIVIAIIIIATIMCRWIFISMINFHLQLRYRVVHSYAKFSL